jgi:hypothetical protein
MERAAPLTVSRDRLRCPVEGEQNKGGQGIDLTNYRRQLRGEIKGQVRGGQRKGRAEG